MGISISEEDLHKCESHTKELLSTLHWVSILGIYLIQTGRYSFTSEIIITLYKSSNTKQLAERLLTFQAQILNPKFFHNMINYLSQIHPQSFLNLCDATILTYPTKTKVQINQETAL